MGGIPLPPQEKVVPCPGCGAPSEISSIKVSLGWTGNHAKDHHNIHFQAENRRRYHYRCPNRCDSIYSSPPLFVDVTSKELAERIAMRGQEIFNEAHKNAPTDWAVRCPQCEVTIFGTRKISIKKGGAVHFGEKAGCVCPEPRTETLGPEKFFSKTTYCCGEKRTVRRVVDNTDSKLLGCGCYTNENRFDKIAKANACKSQTTKTIFNFMKECIMPQNQPTNESKSLGDWIKLISRAVTGIVGFVTVAHKTVQVINKHKDTIKALATPVVALLEAEHPEAAKMLGQAMKGAEAEPIDATLDDEEVA